MLTQVFSRSSIAELEGDIGGGERDVVMILLKRSSWTPAQGGNAALDLKTGSVTNFPVINQTTNQDIPWAIFQQTSSSTLSIKTGKVYQITSFIAQEQQNTMHMY